MTKETGRNRQEGQVNLIQVIALLHNKFRPLSGKRIPEEQQQATNLEVEAEKTIGTIDPVLTACSHIAYSDFVDPDKLDDQQLLEAIAVVQTETGFRDKFKDTQFMRERIACLKRQRELISWHIDKMQDDLDFNSGFPPLAKNPEYNKLQQELGTINMAIDIQKAYDFLQAEYEKRTGVINMDNFIPPPSHLTEDDFANLFNH